MRQGKGQHIDLSQAEAAIHLLAPAILDYELTGEVLQRRGNRDDDMCPHGVFPAIGEDRWVAIACQDDMAWKRSAMSCLLMISLQIMLYRRYLED